MSNSFPYKTSFISMKVPSFSDFSVLQNHIDAFDGEPVSYNDNMVNDFDEFFHPIWWFDSSYCKAESLENCFCGRVDLISVVLENEEESSRNEIFKVHKLALQEAFNHFWSGDSLFTDSSTILDVCPSCLSDGAAHVGLVGCEADDLAVELGAALAIFDYDIKLGAQRF